MSEYFNRISAVAAKEWRLNLRFPLEFFIGHLTSPIKSAILMSLLYSGFFRNSTAFIGGVTNENYVVYVFLGTVLHSQLNSSIGIFRGKMSAEKYWQTATSTLLTPISIFEVITGFMIGSGGITLFINVMILSLVTVIFPISLPLYLCSVFVLFLLSVFGFALGLIGATVSLCWEGKSFLFDYTVQGITFLSCFYYPIEILPKLLQKVVVFMPTYQLGSALHLLYTSNNLSQLPQQFGLMVLTCAAIMIPAGLWFDKSVRKYGITGY